MGLDKAELRYKGRRLVDHMAALLRASGVETVYVSGAVSSYHSIHDVVSDRGPVGGLYSVVQALAESTFDSALVVPVDMPLLTPDLLRRLFCDL